MAPSSRKKSSSRSSSKPQPRDPSDDQAEPLISKESREREYDRVRNGRGGEKPPRGGGKDSSKDDRGSEQRRNKYDHDHDRQTSRDKASKGTSQLKSSKSPQKPSSQRGDPKGKESKNKDSNGLGKFIGRSNKASAPVESLTHSDKSVACSALTTPSALGTVGESGENSGMSSGMSSIHEDEESHEPLLEKHRDRHEQYATGRMAGGRFSKRGGGKRASKSRSNGKPNGRSSSSNGGGDASYARSNLSKSKASKRPWFSSSGSYASKSTSHSLAHQSSGAYGAGTGVQYRSATSTARALEELRRKRLAAQEKRRAAAILACLVVVALGLHFVGRDNGGWRAMLGLTKKEGLRGSRDKVYGDTKDLGYGGERAVAQAEVPGAVAAGGAVATSDGTAVGGVPGAVAAEDEYEYQVPDATEKVYDAEHEFLVPLRHFADVSDPQRGSDTAYFFHVPRAGGSTMKKIIGQCMNLVQSSEVGVRDGHGSDPKLAVIDVQESKYVNVDTTTIPGIQRAVDLGLSSSGMADIIVSSYLHESAALFDLTHQGRAFILLRDPIVRATSMYYHRVKEVGDLDATTTIEDYAQGNGIENNWMCRFLANRMTGELTKDDLEQAKEILKDKFLVGFLDDLEETVYRIMKFNGWKFSTDGTEEMKQQDCIKDSVDGGGSNVAEYEYEIPKRGSQAHALISWQTQFDSKLFAYAQELFEHQTKEWGTKERKKALKKEKKKKAGG